MNTGPLLEALGRAARVGRSRQPLMGGHTAHRAARLPKAISAGHSVETEDELLTRKGAIPNDLALGPQTFVLQLLTPVHSRLPLQVVTRDCHSAEWHATGADNLSAACIRTSIDAAPPSQESNDFASGASLRLQCGDPRSPCMGAKPASLAGVKG
jgi:hypothetical protein